MAFLNGDSMPNVVNDTILVLIPKVKNPLELTQFRPIVLCNVLYKICSKVIANRLRMVLNDIITEEQSAFVSGRLITDNVLLAYELTHLMQTKKGGSDGYAAVKLDMSKAYDRVEWSFLEKMLLKLGFNAGWVQVILNCVSTVTYRIKVNGQLTEEIVPIVVSDKVIPCLPTFSYCVLKLSHACYMKLKGEGS